MKVEPMSKEEIKKLLNERVRKKVILQYIAHRDYLLDKLTTDAIALFANKCISCYDCPLVDYCKKDDECHVNILTYLEKGVAGLNDKGTED